MPVFGAPPPSHTEEGLRDHRESAILLGMAKTVSGFLDVRVDGVSYRNSDRLPNRTGKLFPSASDAVFLVQAFYDRLRMLAVVTGEGGSTYVYGYNGTDNAYNQCSQADLGSVVHDDSLGHGYPYGDTVTHLSSPPTTVTPLFTDADSALFRAIRGLYDAGGEDGIPRFVSDGFAPVHSSTTTVGRAEQCSDLIGYDGPVCRVDSAPSWIPLGTYSGAHNPLTSLFRGPVLTYADAPRKDDPEDPGGTNGYAGCTGYAGYAWGSVSSVLPRLGCLAFRRSRVSDAYANLAGLTRAVVGLRVFGTGSNYMGFPSGALSDGSKFTGGSINGSLPLVSGGVGVTVQVWPSMQHYAATTAQVSRGVLTKPVSVVMVVVAKVTAGLCYEYKYKMFSDSTGWFGPYKQTTAGGTLYSLIVYRPAMESFGGLSVTMSDLGLTQPSGHGDFPLQTASIEARMKTAGSTYGAWDWKWSEPDVKNASVDASLAGAWAVVEFGPDCNTVVAGGASGGASGGGAS